MQWGQSLLCLWRCHCRMLLIFVFVDCWNVALKLLTHPSQDCDSLFGRVGRLLRGIVSSYCISAFSYSFSQFFSLHFILFLSIVSLLSFALHNFDRNVCAGLCLNFMLYIFYFICKNIILIFISILDTSGLVICNFFGNSCLCLL